MSCHSTHISCRLRHLQARWAAETWQNEDHIRHKKWKTKNWTRIFCSTIQFNLYGWYIGDMAILVPCHCGLTSTPRALFRQSPLPHLGRSFVEKSCCKPYLWLLIYAGEHWWTSSKYSRKSVWCIIHGWSVHYKCSKYTYNYINYIVYMIYLYITYVQYVFICTHYSFIVLWLHSWGPAVVPTMQSQFPLPELAASKIVPFLGCLRPRMGSFKSGEN